MKNIKLIQVLMLTFASYQAGAESLPDLYPFRPYRSDVIREHLVRITEDESPIQRQVRLNNLGPVLIGH